MIWSEEKMIIAIHKVIKNILRLFKTKQLEKWYIFKTNKTPPWETHICSLPIGHDRSDRRKMLCKLDESSFCRGKIIIEKKKMGVVL